MLLALWIGLAQAATLTVGEGGDHATLEAAVAAATSGDRLELLNARVLAGVTIDKRLTLAGAGVDRTRVTGASDLLVVTDGARLTVEDLTLAPTDARALQATGATVALTRVAITGGRHPERGGCIALDGGTTTLDAVTFDDCRSPNGLGGALAGDDVTLVIRDSIFTDGRALRGGAVYLSGGKATVRGTTFLTNEARADDERGIGGALATEGTALILRSTRFTRNRVVEGQGGAISVFRGSATLTDVIVEGSPGLAEATRYFGGGLAVYDAPLTWIGGRVIDVDVSHDGSDGSFGYGGGVILYGTRDEAFLIEDVTFTRNEATAFGGAIRIDAGEGTIRGCTFTDNRGDYGAGVHIAGEGAVRVEGSTFTGNTARFAGAIRWRPGGDGLTEARLELVGNTFEDNVADRYGGVLYARNAAELWVEGNRFQDNRAELGGALMVWTVRDIAVLRNRFCANVATGGTLPDGGAIASFVAGNVRYRIANNLFQDNRATAWGGAVSILRDGEAEIVHNTFLGNQAAEGAAVGARGEGDRDVPVVLRHNIVVASRSGDGFAGEQAAAALGWNLYDRNIEQDVDEGLGEASETALRGDPGLRGWSDDGDCSNDDIRLRRDSPAVDAGDPDQADPDGSPPDVGWTGGADADPALWADADEDGAPAQWDCDDTDPGRSPDLEELPYDGIDQDCDGEDVTDVDGDGFDGGDGPDCDDEDPAVNPDAAEIWYDGVDQDCDGNDDDRDLDGFAGGDGSDCDDQDPAVNPDAEEIRGDGLDSDCDGADAPPTDADPAGPVQAEGCGGCQGTGGGALWLALIGGLPLLRRRR